MKLGRQQLEHQHRLFKQWKEKPFDYEIKSQDVQHCSNCGHDFVGNFCPFCSQRAGMGRVTWRSVHQGVMDIWGLGTRSLLYSLLQLLLRPGQFIGDYISGKRQISFPPVKMLFIIALVYSALVYWFVPDVLGSNINIDDTSDSPFKAFEEWTRNHYSWSSLIMSLFAIIPTWVMFRNSPRNTRHLLPEGFFIQIFLSVLSMVISFITIPLSLIDYNVRLFIYMLIVMVYYIIVYKKLFGYSLWGTLWRQGFVFLTVTALDFVIMIGVFGMDPSVYKGSDVPYDSTTINIVTGIAFFVLAVMTLTFGWLCNLVATRWTRRQASQI